MLEQRVEADAARFELLLPARERQPSRAHARQKAQRFDLLLLVASRLARAGEQVPHHLALAPHRAQHEAAGLVGAGDPPDQGLGGDGIDVLDHHRLGDAQGVVDDRLARGDAQTDERAILAEPGSDGDHVVVDSREERAIGAGDRRGGLEDQLRERRLIGDPE